MGKLRPAKYRVEPSEARTHKYITSIPNTRRRTCMYVREIGKKKAGMTGKK